MFKTDQKSLEELSFAFDERDIARLVTILDLIKNKGMSTLTRKDFQRVRKGLARIEALKLEGKVYAFCVEDTYAAKQGGNSGEGVELYLRIGNTLKEFAVNSDRDWVFKVEEVIPILNAQKITKVYTGPIDKIFLNLPRESDPKDPIYRNKLEEYDIAEFQRRGIEVITFERLI